MTPKEVIAFAKTNGAAVVDLKFVDLLGTWQHFTIPVCELDEALFTDGSGFDGSSIRGWQPINASDMLAVPDPVTAAMDPFAEKPTLTLICNVVDPITRESYGRDPRNIARKAEAYVRSSGVGDVAFFGPEPEFFVFDGIRFETNMHESYYHVESGEGSWATGRAESPQNLGYKPRTKEGYFPVPPTDSMQDLRTEMILTMEKVGIHVEKHHHEVATAGQAEIDMRFQPLTKMADWLMWYKYIVKNVARRHGKTATFMPKPLFGDNGTGMHTHQSIWKHEKPLFAGNAYAGVSDTCLHYIGGVLKHGPALAALVCPTTNSYRRIVPGYEAPVNLAYSSRNRSACIRIPMYSPSPKAKRIEVRFPDPTCNPYLAFSAMLLAGLDGIEKKLDPGKPLDKDIYSLSPEELSDVPSLPGSLDDSLRALERDHDFLLKGGVFSRDLIETWVEWKREKELAPVKLRPHPYEFALYFDA
ncbi:MAG: type I glutamate--ammonia ligase [Planctomycetales bacterium]|nr:type I glutamate--ammonia ligase [Planctomycetales bacterium]